MWGRNCSEIVTSGRIFVLTLNRASALKVEGREQNFLLPQNLVANTKRIGLESKLHRLKIPFFCFNSKPSFSFESRRQWTKFPIASKSRCKHKRVGLESKHHRGKISFFCFNSKPSFSFESRRQRITFPVASAYSYKHKRVGLESKLHRAKHIVLSLRT